MDIVFEEEQKAVVFTPLYAITGTSSGEVDPLEEAREKNRKRFLSFNLFF